MSQSLNVLVLVLPFCREAMLAARHAALAAGRHFSVHVLGPLELSPALNQRGQVLAEPLLDELASLGWGNGKLLGITGRDMTAAGSPYVFGMAELGGKAAVVSTFRLRCTQEELFYERVAKEVLHELGHTLGLLHCSEHCVMRFSADVHQVDAKPARFCNTCRRSLTKFQSLADGI